VVSRIRDARFVDLIQFNGLSSPLLHGQPARAGSVSRVAAAEVEACVACAVREHFGDRTQSDDRDLIRDSGFAPCRSLSAFHPDAGQLAVFTLGRLQVGACRS
jgi:hypothetical protein